MRHKRALSARVIKTEYATNDYMELLSRIREQDAKLFATLSPALIQSVNIYLSNKRKFEQEQAMRNEAA